MAYVAVFALEALLFIVSARLALGVSEDLRDKSLGTNQEAVIG
jgi:hypothetical protein